MSSVTSRRGPRTGSERRGGARVGTRRMLRGLLSRSPGEDRAMLGDRGDLGVCVVQMRS